MDYKAVVQNSINYYGLNRYVHNNNKITIVDSIDDYFNVLKKYSSDTYFFRGISKPEQKYSGITRRFYMDRDDAFNIYGSDEIMLFNAELNLIRRFEQKASFLFHGTPSTLDLVAMAQHYTINTRLIDWSSSPLIATLFSLFYPIETNKSQYYLLFVTAKKLQMVIYDLQTTKFVPQNAAHYIIYEDMLRNLMSIYQNRKLNKDAVRNMFNEIFINTNTIKYLGEQLSNESIKFDTSYANQQIDNNTNKFAANRSLFLETCSSNERLTNQRGLFQIAILPTKQYMDNLFYQYEFILINDDIRKEIIDVCDYLGVGLYGLMPDCQSIATVINNNLM